MNQLKDGWKGERRKEGRRKGGIKGGRRKDGRSKVGRTTDAMKEDGTTD